MTRSGTSPEQSPSPRESAILAALRGKPLSLQALALALNRPPGSIAATMRRLMRANLVRMRLDLGADPPARIYRLSVHGRRSLSDRPRTSGRLRTPKR